MRSVLKIYTYPVLPQVPKRKSCLSNGHWTWHWSINRDISYTCWSDDFFFFAGKSGAVGNSSNNNSVTVCRCVCVAVSLI